LPYIGNSPALKYASFAVQHFTTSATTTYTLDHAVANENDIRLVINNVIQQPGSGKAYTASATTLTLSAATSGTDTMYCVFLGKAVQTVVPPAGSVTGSTLADDVISAQSALGATPADTDEFLVSDAGVLKRVDYSYMKASTTDEFRSSAGPIFYNGDMQVSQRATTKTGITGSGYYTVDRMKVVGDIGTWTDTQETLTSGNAFNAGFQKAYRTDCTTANASPSSGSAKIFTQYFEGRDLGMFKKGTSNAEKWTLAFWVKSNKTGTGQVNLLDKDNNRLIGATYTISVANTWEHKVCNYAADTTGSFDNDNARSLDIEWWLDSGSDFDSGTMPTAWEAEANADSNASGTLNLGDNTANDWAITGVQLEVGEYSASTLPPYQFETYGNNLARCQRYYYLHADTAQDGGPTIGNGSIYNATTAQISVDLPVNMRTNVSISSVNVSSGYVIFHNGGTTNYNYLTVGNGTYTSAGCTSVMMDVSGATSMTGGQACWTRGNSTGAGVMCAFSAEL